mgnify:FL=1
MEYKLIITKENGDTSAELQTLDQSHRQAFNLLDVILDYTNIKRTEHGKRGRPKTYFDLQNHVFGCLFSNTEVPYDAAWMELRYDNVKKSFQFLSEAEPVLKESRKLPHKRAEEILKLARKYDAKLSVNIYQSEQSSIESGSISYSIPIIEYSTVAHSDHWVEYSCCTALDMVVAIMHYYALNGYKMAVCRHCGRGFVTTNFKQLYCGRISSYQNRFSQKRSSPKTCEETVRQTIQFLRAEKNAVIRRAATNPDVQLCSGKGSEFYNRLVSECDTYMDKIKHKPTPQNFDEFGQYLFETNQKKEWKK